MKSVLRDMEEHREGGKEVILDTEGIRGSVFVFATKEDSQGEKGSW